MNVRRRVFVPVFASRMPGRMRRAMRGGVGWWRGPRGEAIRNGILKIFYDCVF